MKKIWLEKNECTGCSACANICPKNAIQMKNDEYGFIYPVINESCIDCNMCERICKKRLTDKNINSTSPNTYAVWAKNENIRFNSTSGGVFSILANSIIDQKGYVCGAQYNKDNLVEHVVVSSEDGIEKIRQSKYIQSDIGDIFKKIKIKLSQGKVVAFCGAPCQVAGLKAFLGKNYENLYTFDFICRGMNSPKAYKSWLTEIENKEQSKVEKVWFKYKVGGWKKSPRCTRVDFTNGQTIIFDQDENLFMSGYLGPNLYIRPVCGNCEFKGVPRQGDITLADFWGIEEKLDDDKGTSLVLINNEKGQTLFNNVNKDLIVTERSFTEIFNGNVCFNSSVDIPKNSAKFLKDLDNNVFSEVLQKYTKIPFSKKIYRKIKKQILTLAKK